MNVLAFAQRVFYPRTDTADAARQAARNGGIAGWIKVADHFVLGAFLIVIIAPGQEVLSGDQLIPATIQFFIALAYGFAGTRAWKGSRAGAVTVLMLVILDSLLELALVGGTDVHALVNLAAFILAVGGVRGAFACARHERAAA
jgi:hypothetical protein